MSRASHGFGTPQSRHLLSSSSVSRALSDLAGPEPIGAPRNQTASLLSSDLLPKVPSYRSASGTTYYAATFSRDQRANREEN
ncbi:hypothetical protein MRX96_029296 [Rhipicephalus microplus]